MPNIRNLVSPGFLMVWLLTAWPAAAANECQVQVTKSNHSITTLNVNKSSSVNYDLTIQRAYVMGASNNVLIEILNDQRLAYNLKANQTLLLPNGSRLRKIQCFTARSVGASGTFEPTPDQIVGLFTSNLTLAAQGLRDVHDMGVEAVVKLLIQQGKAADKVTQAARSAFGGSQTIAEQTTRGLFQAGVNPQNIATLVYRHFGNQATGPRMTRWLRNAGFSVAAQMAQITKTVYGASRQQAEQWMSQAGWAAAQIQAALDAAFGSAVGTAAQTATDVTGAGLARLVSVRWAPASGQNASFGDPMPLDVRRLQTQSFAMTIPDSTHFKATFASRVRECSMPPPTTVVAILEVDTKNGTNLPLRVIDSSRNLLWFRKGGFTPDGRIDRRSIRRNRTAQVMMEFMVDGRKGIPRKGLSATLTFDNPGGGRGQLHYEIAEAPGGTTFDNCFPCEQPGQSCRMRTQQLPRGARAVLEYVPDGSRMNIDCVYYPTQGPAVRETQRTCPGTWAAFDVRRH